MSMPFSNLERSLEIAKNTKFSPQLSLNNAQIKNIINYKSHIETAPVHCSLIITISATDVVDLFAKAVNQFSTESGWVHSLHWPFVTNLLDLFSPPIFSPISRFALLNTYIYTCGVGFIDKAPSCHCLTLWHFKPPPPSPLQINRRRLTSLNQPAAAVALYCHSPYCW